MSLTRFQRARILGARALQISLGAPPFMLGAESSDPLKAAEEEMREGRLPLHPRRSEDDTH